MPVGLACFDMILKIYDLQERLKKRTTLLGRVVERRKGLVCCYNCNSVVTIEGSINRTTSPLL